MAGTKRIGLYRPARDEAGRPKCHHRRTKFERAGDIAQSMRKVYHSLWPGTFWPSAHCFNTCLILAPIIRSSLEWEVRVAVGTAYQLRGHAWIVTPDDDIIDPTYGQFDGGPALRVLPACDNHLLNHQVIKVLSLESEREAFEALKPLSGEDGWQVGSDVIDMFAAINASAVR